MPSPVLGVLYTSIKDFAIFPPHQKEEQKKKPLTLIAEILMQCIAIVAKCVALTATQRFIVSKALSQQRSKSPGMTIYRGLCAVRPFGRQPRIGSLRKAAMGENLDLLRQETDEEVRRRG